MYGSLINPHVFNKQIIANYESSFGLDLNGFFKAFTTKSDIGYIPHYESGIVSGLIGSYSLNPYGIQSTFEGLIYGTGLYPSNDLESNGLGIRNNRLNIRSFGIKIPQTFVGWGYDIFGYPTPNESSGWSASGRYSNTSPSFNFALTPSGVGSTGADVTEGMWNAGPVDLRWDNHRKVWTGNYGSYPARIVAAYNTGRVITDFTTPYFAENLTYDARIYDGSNSGIVVTGQMPVNQRPQPNTYKVYPLNTGKFVFIVNTEVANGRPGFGIYDIEPPYAVDCASTTSELTSSLIESDFINYFDLLSNPLGVEYGGTSYGEYDENDILIAGTGNLLLKKTLFASTGIDITINDSKVLISLQDSVDFSINGVNTSIHALSGLTEPLSITQGGTGATGKIFVDVYSNQTVSGIKNFYDTIRFTNGSISVPSISFVSGINTGFNYTDYIVNHIASGTKIFNTTPTGNVFYRPVWIQPTEGYYSPLIVQQRMIVGAYIGGGYQYHSTDIQQWRSATGVVLAEVGMSGHVGGIELRCYNSGRLGCVNLIANTGINTSNNVYLPSQTGTLALVHNVCDTNDIRITEPPIEMDISILMPTVGFREEISTNVLTSGTAYGVFLGKSKYATNIKYIAGKVYTAGSAAQVAEYGIFTSDTGPDKTTVPTLTKIEATGGLDSMNTDGWKRNLTPFLSTVPTGKYVWLLFRPAFSLNDQPAFSATCTDAGGGRLIKKDSVSALTGLSQISSMTVISSTGLCPFLRAELI